MRVSVDGQKIVPVFEAERLTFQDAAFLGPLRWVTPLHSFRGGALFS